jgi:hypothetical protein
MLNLNTVTVQIDFDLNEANIYAEGLRFNVITKLIPSTGANYNTLVSGSIDNVKSFLNEYSEFATDAADVYPELFE